MTHIVKALIIVILLMALAVIMPAAPVHAEADFTGTVLSVDEPAGKVVVKTEGSGTRFTFVVNEKTEFQGAKNLKDIKKGQSLTIRYQASGSQYVARKITAKK
jgi:hypothetical protein